MNIICGKLTTCSVASAGKSIRLGLLDQTGTETTLELPFEQAQAIAMTLPRLLSQALKSQTEDNQARYVFPLGGWIMERSLGRDGPVLTLVTEDGFEAFFGVPAAMCRHLGWTLAGEADEQTDPTPTALAARH